MARPRRSRAERSGGRDFNASDSYINSNSNSEIEGTKHMFCSPGAEHEKCMFCESSSWLSFDGLAV